MDGRRLLRTCLASAVAIGTLALASSAYAEPSSPVPLEHRTWRVLPRSEPAASGAHGMEGNSIARHRTVSHAKEVTDRFHVTAVRLWLYRSFLPKSDDSDVLGIETNSAWSWERFDF